MLSTGSLGLGGCGCPCHLYPSRLNFCKSCYVVVCKTIRNAGQGIDIEAEILAKPFKSEGKDIDDYEIGR